MKRTFTLTFAAALFLGTSMAQSIQVPETNAPLVTKVTATWCGPCGSWGWDLFSEVIDEAGDDALIFSAYASTSGSWDNAKFHNSIAAAYANDRGVSGYPTFHANGDDFSGSGADIASMAANMATEPVEVQAGFGFEYNGEGDEVKIIASTKFFEQVSGEYYMAVYIIEDEAEAPQNGQTGQTEDTQHHQVLRGEVSGEAFGTLMDGSGTHEAKKKVTEEFILEVDPAWNTDHLKFGTVIWKKESGVYTFVNANLTPSKISNEAPVGVNEIANPSAVVLFPNPANDNVTVRIQNATEGSYSINIFNQLGQNVKSVYTGGVSGDRNFTVSTDDLANGMYYVKVNNGVEVQAIRLNVVH